MPAVPANLRLLNQAQLLEALFDRGTASRADLAKTTRLSQPTAGKIADDLLASHVLEELPADTGKGSVVGRPGKQLRLSRAEPRFVLIELGVERTRILGAPVAPLEDEHWDLEFKTPSSEALWLKAMRSHKTKISTPRPWGVLVSAPGVIDEREGKILLCPNLHWAERTDFGQRLREVFGAPVVLLQEIQALSLGELAGRRADEDFLLVDIGDGVGGSVVIGGKPFSGPLPLHGEIGHTPIPGNTRPCGCGGTGCLETLIAEPGLLASFKAAGHREATTFAQLAHAVDGAKVPRWLSAALDALTMCIVAALNLYGLPRVVLTGRINELGEPVRDQLQAAIARSALWARFDKVEVCFAPRHRARGLGLAAFQRFIVPGEFGRAAAEAVGGGRA